MPRKLLVLVVALVVLCGLAAADDWNKTFQVSGSPTLSIDTSDGNIRVDTWDQNRIEARVTTSGYKIGPNDVGISESQTGDHVSLEVHIPNMHVSFGWNHHRVDIDIHMPKQGTVDFRTHDGSIKLANFKGDMHLKSGDGSQTIDNVDGSLEASAGDGSLKVSGRFDHLDLHTGDGRIEARANAGSKVNSGWSLHTGDGSIHLDLPGDFAADVEARSGDGHINFDMPVTVSGSMSRNDIHGKMNGGGGLLRLRSGDGSIYVRREMV
jgi:DUF4097 and DUF4098 domain-containing protein YvlB